MLENVIKKVDNVVYRMEARLPPKSQLDVINCALKRSWRFRYAERHTRAIVEAKVRRKCCLFFELFFDWYLPMSLWSVQSWKQLSFIETVNAIIYPQQQTGVFYTGGSQMPVAQKSLGVPSFSWTSTRRLAHSNWAGLITSDSSCLYMCSQCTSQYLCQAQ